MCWNVKLNVCKHVILLVNAFYVLQIKAERLLICHFIGECFLCIAD